MSKQNIFDHPGFFEGYQALRENPDSANNLEEKPALFSMLGKDIKGKRILDLGCGYGENCKAFSHMGAVEVAGVDISEKMLKVAEEKHSGKGIRYYHMPMEEISSLLPKQFDWVVSSLALHYVEDFSGLAMQISAFLPKGGHFLFSQEHPLTTAPAEGAVWIKGESGEPEHYRLTDYGRPGKRSVTWLVDGVVKYHRTFSDIVNSLSRAGFWIEDMREPTPSQELASRFPSWKKDFHKPNFLLIKARKL